MVGIMNPQNNKSELLNAIRTAFGPRSGETQSLQQRIEALTQSQLQTVTDVCSASENGSDMLW